MGRGLGGEVRSYIQKARDFSLQAVSIYNNPLAESRTASFIVLMHIAWNSLFLGVFLKRKIQPFYRDNSQRRFLKADGQKKTWDLSQCIKQYWAETTHPVRKNLEFLDCLRHRIVHGRMPTLIDDMVFAECQANLINFQEMLVEHFGKDWAMDGNLSLVIQFSGTVTDEQRKALIANAKGRFRDVIEFIETFRSSLSPDVWNSRGFRMAFYLIPQLTANPSPDAIGIEWIKDLTDEQIGRLNVMIRTRTVPEPFKDLLRAGMVVNEVNKRLTGRQFSMHEHTLCWRYYKVRPLKCDPQPDRTQTNYCVYNPLYKDYLYKPAWVRFLVEKLSDESERERILASGRRTNGFRQAGT
jgi:hypothetical protein